MNRRILFINDRLDGGGVELIMQSLCAYVLRQGEQVTIYAPDGDSAILAEKYGPQVKWKPWPFWRKQVKRFSPAHFAQKFCKIIFESFLLKFKKWDIVVSFKEGPSMLLASKLRAGRKLAWVHTDFGTLHSSADCFPDTETERRCMQGFDAVATVSQAACRGLKQLLGDPGNVKVVYNPIDHHGIEAKAKEFCPEKPEGKCVLVSVGRLCDQKRPEMLIDICNGLNESFPLELWLIGGGELEDSLRKKLEAERIDCVKLLGQKSNPYPYIAAADWLVSSSETESYGLTIQEALILGVPVIACACPAIRENMQEGFGLLSGMSEGELKETVKEALSHKELRENCARNIAARYDKNLLWEARLEKMYQFLIGE